LHISHRLLPLSSSVAAGGGRAVAWRVQLLKKVLFLATLLPPKGAIDVVEKLGAVLFSLGPFPPQRLSTPPTARQRQGPQVL
jgi:hypothetical protein